MSNNGKNGVDGGHAGSVSESMEAGEPGSPEDFSAVEEKEFPKTLGKFYRVTRKIGEGGMGVVFEVEHTRMGKKFAAKVILQSFATDRDAVKRFELEAVAASKIESPHIVQVTHLDTEGDFTYIIMELLKGRSLAALIDKRPIPARLAVEIARQTAKGLIAAHEAGIVHRDLKPENIFLINQEGDLYVKILDFGISKIRLGPDANVRLTKTGQIIGTPLYFSPEQAKGMSEVDGRTDIYAMGVILFEMLTGKPVFDASNPLELMLKHASQQPPSLTDVMPTVPERLDRIVMKCLAKDVNKRYQTAGELMEDLGKLELGPVEKDTVVKATTTTDPLLHISESTKMELSVREKRGKTSKVVFTVVGVLLVLGVVFGALAYFSKGSGKQTGVDEEGPAVKGQVREAAEGKEAEEPVTKEDEEPSETGEEEAAAQVALSITSTPDGAEVWIDGYLAGNTPFVQNVDRDGAGITFELKAKGYKKETITLTAAEDLAEHVKLTKVKKQIKDELKPQ